jgi:hypothetical protein
MNEVDLEWVKFAQIALAKEGVDSALRTLGTYLALNPQRADALAAEYEESR